MFIDTNVLIYAGRATSQFHGAARRAIEDLAHSGQRGRLSRQILREYLDTSTRPQGTMVPLSMAEACDDIAALAAAYEILEDGPVVGAEFLRLCRTMPLAGRQVHDANIAATMLAHGEGELLTFNAADFARFPPAITVTVP